MSLITLFNKKSTLITGLIIIASIFLSSLLFVPKTLATSFVVTTNTDSGAGSLRDAMDQAEANPGLDAISFNLPSGQTLIQPLSPLPALTEAIIIDATTQPGYVDSPIIEISGISAGNSDVNGINLYNIHSTASIIKGLSITSFSGFGIAFYAFNLNNNLSLIQGNYIGVKPDGVSNGGNILGGIDLGQYTQVGGVGKANRNIISGNGGHGIRMFNTSDVTIQNNYIGTNAFGNSAVPNLGNGITMLGEGEGGATLIDAELNQNNIIGLNVNGGGNLISGNTGNGIYAQTSKNLTIHNNIIGLSVDQNNKIPNGTTANAGIYFDDMVIDFRIGGTGGNESNIISGNTGNGLYIYGAESSNGTIQNNIIGSNPNGALNFGNTLNGALIYSSHDILMGGIGGSSTKNIISNNGKHGVSIEKGVSLGNPPYNITMLGNAIKNNTNLGINLENIAENSSFIDPNDTLDPDTGPNDLQNSPIIVDRVVSNTMITVNGILNTEANSNYRIELFATNPVYNVDSDREGAEIIGSTQVTTDTNGNGTWSITNIPLSYQNHTYSSNATRFIPDNLLGTGFNPKSFASIGNDSYFGTSEFSGLNFANATVTKSHNRPTGVAPGNTVNYTIPAINPTSLTLNTVTVTDTLDPNFTYTSGSCAPNSAGITCSFDSGTNTLTWTIPTIAPNSTTNLTYQVTVNTLTPTTITLINNTATLIAPSITTQTNSVSLGINHPVVATSTPSNNLSVRSDKSQILSGESLTYNITFTNNGSIVLNGVQVQTTLDPNLEFVSCSNSCTQNGQILTWNVGIMNISQSNTNTLTVKAKPTYTGNVITTSNLTANELPTAKTQSIITPVLNLDTTTTLPRTGGSSEQNSFLPLLAIVLGLLLLKVSVKTHRRKISVLEIK
jgi:uncharacterized repeat protein (TIGR01451 family)